MAVNNVELRISELNPLRFVQSNKIDYNYATANFQNTLWTVNGNRFKYIQGFGVNDALRVQFCTYGTFNLAEGEWTLVAKLHDINDVVIETLTITEKTGTFNNDDLRVWEIDYNLATVGQYYVSITFRFYNGIGWAKRATMISESFIVDGVYNCLPKIQYKDTKNYPIYDLYFATGISFQLRADVRLNQLPQLDTVSYNDNIKKYQQLTGRFYYNYELYTAEVLPVWIASRIKFALGLDYCYVNFEPISATGNDEIELVEDGLNACTFKFKTTPNEQTMSISMDDGTGTPDEFTKDFTNIVCNPSAQSGTCSPWQPCSPVDATHNQLMGLDWLSSGHTGNANKIFGSDGSGNAKEYALTDFETQNATTSDTSGAITLAKQTVTTLTTTLTNAHTLTIIPELPTVFTNRNYSEVVLTVGATAPSITWSAPSGVTFTWTAPLGTPAGGLKINTKHKLFYDWESETSCLISRREL